MNWIRIIGIKITQVCLRVPSTLVLAKSVVSGMLANPVTHFLPGKKPTLTHRKKSKKTMDLPIPMR